MFKFCSNSVSALLLSATLVMGSLFSVTSQAAMVSTHAALAQQQLEYDQAQLMSALNQEGVRDQLMEMGVNPDQIEQRIATLTPDELVQFNQALQNDPAGQGVVGILLTLFIIFVITDMLCATDLFSFVKCINR